MRTLVFLSLLPACYNASHFVASSVVPLLCVLHLIVLFIAFAGAEMEDTTITPNH